MIKGTVRVSYGIMEKSLALFVREHAKSVRARSTVQITLFCAKMAECVEI